MKIRSIIWSVLMSMGLAVSAQTNLDSLYQIWADPKQSDSVRTEAYYSFLSEGYVYNQPDSAIDLAKELEDFATLNKYPEANALAQRIKARCFGIKSDFQNALKLYAASLSFFEEKADTQTIASLLHDIGRIYYEQGIYVNALTYYERAWKLYSTIGNDINSVDIQTSIGATYNMQNQGFKALEYYQRCLKISTEINYGHGIANSLSNIAGVYADNSAQDKALEHWQRSLAKFKEIGSDFGVALVHANLGYVYTHLDQFSLADQHLKQSLSFYQNIGERSRTAYVYRFMGFLYNKQNKRQKAIEVCRKAMALSQEVGALAEQEKSCRCLYTAYKGTGNTDSALLYHEKWMELLNQLQYEETAVKLNQIEMEKDLAIDSIQQAEKNRQVLLSHQSALKRKNQQRNLVIIAAILLLVLIWGLYGRWKKAIAERNLTEEKIDRVLQFEQLRKLDTIMEGQEMERKRIFEDLHDKLGGKFNALNFTWSSIYAEELEAGTEKDKELKALDSIIQSLSSEIRSIIKNNTHSSGEFGLTDSLEELKYLVQSSHKMEINTLVHGIGTISKTVSLELYKVILELVGNALKYSKGSHINVHLNQVDHHITLIVEDDGVGFNVEEVRTGMGLINIRSRAERLGGIVEIDSKLGKGTTVILELDV